ncbi:MAG: hypothetical protein WCK02_15775 [Bacteroidota bacterium]
METTYYRLLNHCFFFKGYKQGLIVNSKNANVNIVPNSLGMFIHESKRKSALQLGILFKDKQVIKEYIKFLKENECIFECDIREKKYFTDNSYIWDIPTKITNSILDIDIWDLANIFKSINQLCTNRCFHIQIRIFSDFVFDNLLTIIDLIQNTSIKSVSIIAKNIDENSINILTSFNKLTHIYIFNTDSNKVISSDALIFSE